MDLWEVHWQTRRRLSVKNTGIVKFPSHGADKCPEPQRGAATHKRKHVFVLLENRLGLFIWAKSVQQEMFPLALFIKCQTLLESKNFLLSYYLQANRTNCGFHSFGCSDGEIKIKKNLFGTFSFVPGENSYLISEKKKVDNCVQFQ